MEPLSLVFQMDEPVHAGLSASGKGVRWGSELLTEAHSPLEGTDSARLDDSEAEDSRPCPTLLLLLVSEEWGDVLWG